LLQEGMWDPLFEKYSVIILDEVHERTINTDILLGQVKNAQLARASTRRTTQLKIIVMSATMDVDKFSKHFNNAKVVYIEGRQHNISIFQTLKTQEDYCFSTLSLILKLHSELPPSHNILAFLTGQYEIESLVSFLKKSCKGNNSVPMEVNPLYAALSPDEQMKVLAPTPEGTRRVVISTNIAETSLTIPGIKIVIDCGYVKAKFHEYGFGLDTLGIVKISKAQAMQRAGRAGRESGGTCYRLYSKEFFAALDENTVPEIQRVQLSRCVLHLLEIGLQPFNFSWIDKPSDRALAKALKELHSLDAIQISDNRQAPDGKELPMKPRITKLGEQIISIPLEPTFAAVLLKAQNFHVVEPTACILSMLCSESIFRGKDEATYNAKVKFGEPEGDLIMYVKIFREFKKCQSKFEWCKLNSLNFRALSYALKVHEHLMALCRPGRFSLGLDLRNVSWDDAKENIRKCFLNCMPENVAVLNKGKGNDYHILHRGKMAVKIHRESSLHNKGCPTVHFTELTKVASGTNYIRHVSMINSKWV